MSPQRNFLAKLLYTIFRKFTSADESIYWFRTFTAFNDQKVGNFSSEKKK